MFSQQGCNAGTPIRMVTEKIGSFCLLQALCHLTGLFFLPISGCKGPQKALIINMGGIFARQLLKEYPGLFPPFRLIQGLTKAIAMGRACCFLGWPVLIPTYGALQYF